MNFTWNTIEYQSNIYDIKTWADVLHIETANVQAVYHEKFYAGKPAVTSNGYGSGETVYCGVAGCQDFIHSYLPNLIEKYHIKAIPVPEEVYVSIRENSEKTYLFLINMNRTSRTVNVPYSGIDQLSHQRVGNQIDLPPLGVVLLDCDK